MSSPVGSVFSCTKPSTSAEGMPRNGREERKSLSAGHFRKFSLPCRGALTPCEPTPPISPATRERQHHNREPNREKGESRDHDSLRCCTWREDQWPSPDSLRHPGTLRQECRASWLLILSNFASTCNMSGMAVWPRPDRMAVWSRPGLYRSPSVESPGPAASPPLDSRNPPNTSMLIADSPAHETFLGTAI
jgi:hypothetical protein